MVKPSDKILIIIKKYLNDEATDAEVNDLLEWVKSDGKLEAFKEQIKLEYLLNRHYKKYESDFSFDELENTEQKETKVIGFMFRRFLKYAAALIIIVATGYFLTNDKIIDDSSDVIIDDSSSIINNNIEIGTDKATLTLEDGATIALEKGKQYVSDKVTSDGETIIYGSPSDKTKEEVTEIAYNYLTVPRGGEFYIVLADATKVWLNSESQIKYPVSFIPGKTREVELLYGEAYFEVSPSSSHNGASFKVIQNNQTVEVLGTEFNIKAYRDETAIYTTLVEGKVAVKSGLSKKVLMPKQQLKYTIHKETMDVTTVDVYSVTAWRKGIFSFKNKSLKDIMKVLARWYDAEFIFENKDIENLEFNGILNKKQSIEEILSIIYTTNNIAYEINNKTIVFK